MKILVITTSYGTYSDSHTIRLSNVLGCISKNNDITISYPGNKKVSLIPGVTPSPIGLTSKLKLLEFFSRFNKLLYLVYLNILKKTSSPDMFNGLTMLFKQYFRDKKKFDYDIVITASGSLESHRAGYELSKYYGVPLMCDYGDPISPLINCLKKRKSIEIIERKILVHARAILFTTESTRAQYSDLFNIGSKSHVIRYGFNSNEIKGASCDGSILSLLNKSKGVKYISHIGTAFVNDRNLIPLIDAICSTNKNIGLILAGRRSRAFSKHARQVCVKNFIDLDKVDYDSSLYLQCHSYLNVIVGNKDGRQVPGKVFIAIGCGQPILYISQCDEKDDEALSILRGYSALFVTKNNVKNIKAAIDTIFATEISVMKSNTFGAQYEVKSLTSQLEGVINGS